MSSHKFSEIQVHMFLQRIKSIHKLQIQNSFFIFYVDIIYDAKQLISALRAKSDVKMSINKLTAQFKFILLYT